MNYKEIVLSKIAEIVSRPGFLLGKIQSLSPD